MAFGKAEQVEVDAYLPRYNHLLALGDEKNAVSINSRFQT
jgi:hypothetical protein